MLSGENKLHQLKPIGRERRECATTRMRVTVLSNSTNTKHALNLSYVQDRSPLDQRLLNTAMLSSSMRVLARVLMLIRFPHKPCPKHMICSCGGVFLSKPFWTPFKWMIFAVGTTHIAKTNIVKALKWGLHQRACSQRYPLLRMHDCSKGRAGTC